jgi:hypothetical protein
VLASGKSSLQACDRGRQGPHPFCNLGLGKPGIVSRLEQLIEKFTFFSFDPLNLLAHTWAAQQLGDDLIMSCHA